MVADDIPLEIEVEAARAPAPGVQFACPACGQHEAHYVPPRLGKADYFTCQGGDPDA